MRATALQSCGDIGSFVLFPPLIYRTVCTYYAPWVLQRQWTAAPRSCLQQLIYHIIGRLVTATCHLQSRCWRRHSQQYCVSTVNDEMHRELMKHCLVIRVHALHIRNHRIGHSKKTNCWLRLGAATMQFQHALFMASVLVFGCSAVLLHYHMKFQVNPRVNLEASCCALFCYEYLRALYGRDAFCLWCFSSWHNAGPQAAGQLCFCTLTCRSVAFARVNLEVLCRIHIVTLLFYFVVLLLFFTNHIT